jgi:rapamycin-insensitive companion of mTOR
VELAETLFLRSLSRDSKHEHEKIHAMRLIRHLFSFGVATEIDCSIVKAVIAIAENIEDRLRVIALETLGELGMYKAFKPYCTSRI